MTVAEINLEANDRLIVFAPHPDDESLACGGLIQRAVNLGASVLVVVATGGGANPWPQRLAEGRWRLDATASQRWESRRRGEVDAALSLLGLSAGDARFLGWEDQGLTTRLMEDGAACVARLRDILLAFKPTMVAMPSHLDSHPDHSALSLLLHAAMAAAASPARCLAYWLHGRRERFVPTVQITLTGREMSTKRAASLAHVSQTHFGTARLLRFVGCAEQFIEHGRMSSPACDTWHWEFAASNLFSRVAIRRLRIAAISEVGHLHAITFPLRNDARAGVMFARRGMLRLDATVLACGSKPAWVVAKLENTHGLFVYDAMGWTERITQDSVPPRASVPGTRLRTERASRANPAMEVPNP